MQQDLTTGVSTAEPIAEPRWGLGDVVLGVVLAQVLAVIAFTIASSIAGWKTVDDVPLWGTALLQIPLWGGWVFAVVVAGRMKGNGVVRDFGFRMKLWDPLIGLAAGIGLQLVVLPLLYIPLLALFDQSSNDLERPAQQLADKAGSSWNWVVLVLIVGIGAPIIEELFYRGLLLRSLTKRRFCPPWVSAVICAADLRRHALRGAPAPRPVRVRPCRLGPGPSHRAPRPVDLGPHRVQHDHGPGPLPALAGRFGPSANLGSFLRMFADVVSGPGSRRATILLAWTALRGTTPAPPRLRPTPLWELTATR